MYLTIRYGLSILVSLGNMFVLTWWIGPHAYGLFVTAVGLTGFLASLSRFGVDTYLVRRDPAPSRRQYNVAFTVILALSILLVIAGCALAPLLKPWYAADEFVAPYLALLLSIPLIGLAGPATAKLERDLNFRAAAGVELGGQVAAFAISAVMAWHGFGVWAPVGGIFVWQGVALLGACRAARFLPRLHFDLREAGKMLAFGLGFSASMRAWQLRSLVNPLLVGRFAGAEGVAFVAFAIRIAESLSFVRTAAGRLAIAALARLQQDREKFQQALERALWIQVLTLGPLLCAFALCGPWLAPRFMGQRWSPALQVYPFVAAGVLINSIYNLQASALFVVGQQWAVVRAYASHVVLLAGGTFLLLPQLGISGYGWAELLACAGYFFIQSSVSKIASLGHHQLPLAWVAVFLLPLMMEVIHVRPSIISSSLLLSTLVVAGWHRGRAATFFRQAERIFPASQHMRRLITFLMKARRRGWRYVRDIARYKLASLSYRLCRTGLRYSASARLQDVQLPDDAVFHFAAEDIPNIVARVPAPLKCQTLFDADRILNQHFRFRGQERAFPGGVDWNWYPDGNLSWHWDLNRHAFFLKLAAAYYYTGNRGYMIKLLALWENWITSNPAGLQGWKYPFEAAVRLQNWIWAYFLAAYSKIPTQEQLRRLAFAIREHAEYVACHFEYHWPNNHLLLEVKALYEFALLFAPTDAALVRRTQRMFERQVMAQILPDGAHAELCSMYHRIIAGELEELALLCQRQGRPLPDAIGERIARMAEFSRAGQRADGSAALLGDSAADDSCLRFDFSRPQHFDFNYWVGYGDSPACSSKLGIAQPDLRVFADSGYAFLRSQSGANQIHLTFDVGPFSRCASPNHAHCDALSFELWVNGQPIIVDPGFYFSWTEARWQRYFRATGSHNTLKIDGKEQSDLSDFADVPRVAHTRVLSHCADHREASVRAACIPYWADGEGVQHIREIHVCDNTMLIRDRVTGAGQHWLEWSFQFAPELQVDPQGNGTLAGRRKRLELFSMRITGERCPTLQLYCGQTRPLRGWVSRNSGEVLPAPLALYSLHTELPFEVEFALQLPS